MTVKISELPVATEFESGDVIPIVQDGSTKQLDADGNWTFGAIDGTPIGGSTPSTGAFTSVNIDGGNIDGTPIGANSADEGNFTTLDASGDVTIADKIVHAGDTNTAIRFPSADTVTFETAGTEAMRIDFSGNVGIGTSCPDSKLDLFLGTTTSGNYITTGNTNRFGNGTSKLITFKHGYNTPQEVVAIAARTVSNAPNTDGRGYLDFYTGTSGTNDGGSTSTVRMAIDYNGAVNIPGSLSKGSGSFKIDHPLKPETHHLVHSFIEGPQADLIYRGKVDLVNGKATVNIDEAGRMTEGTFEALNCNVQCFATNEDGWTCVRGSVSDNILTIEAEDNACTDTVSWMVIGERCDQHMIDTEWTDENGRVITEPEKDENDES